MTLMHKDGRATTLIESKEPFAALEVTSNSDGKVSLQRRLCKTSNYVVKDNKDLHEKKAKIHALKTF